MSTSAVNSSSLRWLTHGVLPLSLCAALLVPFVLPHWVLGAGWWHEFSDLAHFFSFGALALLGIWVLRPWHKSTVLKSVALAMAIVACSVATEMVQHYMHPDRSGSVADVVRNCLGGLGFTALFAALIGSFTTPLRFAFLLVALTLIGQAIYPLFTQWQWQQLREQQLPVLYDFDEAWEARQVEWTHAKPVARENWAREQSPTLSCPEEIWSGIRFLRVWPHWGTQEQLTLELTAKMDAASMPFQVYVAFVDDLQQLQPHWGIAYTELQAGLNTVNIPFSEILFDDKPVNFDSVRVQFIDFYKPEYQGPLTLGIERIELSTLSSQHSTQAVGSAK